MKEDCPNSRFRIDAQHLRQSTCGQRAAVIIVAGHITDDEAVVGQGTVKDHGWDALLLGVFDRTDQSLLIERG